jgi:hypothetical protein
MAARKQCRRITRRPTPARPAKEMSDEAVKLLEQFRELEASYFAAAAVRDAIGGLEAAYAMGRLAAEMEHHGLRVRTYWRGDAPA